MLIANSAVRIGLAMLTAAALTSCGSQADGPKANDPHGTPSAPNAPATRLAEPPGGYDIGGIAKLADQLPPGFTATQIPRTTLTKDQADAAAGLAKQFTFTFDPPQCNSVLKPVGVGEGWASQGLIAQGPQEVTVVAVQSPQAHPDPVLGAGCNHVTFKAQGNMQGTAELLAGPAIADATTAAVKLHLDFAMPGLSKTIDRLTYFATIGDKTAVEVDGESNPELLADLLVKAVAAIRQH